MQMGMTVAVAGASGYAGGELLRLVLAHPDLTLGALAAGSNAGQDVTSVHPGLPQLAGRQFVEADAALLGESDLVLLALPHGQSAAIVAALPDTLRIVDLGADFRLDAAADWDTYYGGAHAGTWDYGLPELPGARERVAAATRVANPGCYATATILGLAPLLAAGLVDGTDIVTTAASGTSGAGRGTKPSLMASEVMGSMSVYKAGGVHQHTPEIEQALRATAGGPVTVSFTPMLAPMPRGIVVASTARLVPGTTSGDLRRALQDAYADEPFVHVLPPDTWPATGATAGSNCVHVQAAADAHSRRAVVVTALDNLVKGAAGQAIQNANLMLGLDETTGLSASAVAP